MFRFPASLIFLAAVLASIPQGLDARIPAGFEEPEKHPALSHLVTVTANRLETPEIEVGSSITVLDRKALDESKKTTVLEVLRDVAGLSLQQNGPPGGAASVFIRGANPEHTLVLVDGVEMNDPVSPTRMFDLAHLRIEEVDRIEILRGPQSTLYGSDAMGGVIHIITREGRGSPKLGFSALGGSRGTLSVEADVRGSSGPVSFSLSSSLYQTEGFSSAGASYLGNTEKDGWRNIALSARWGWEARPGWRFALQAGWNASRMDLDNFGGDYGDDPNYRQDHRSFFLRSGFQARLADGRWEQRLDVSLVGHDRDYDNPPDEAHPFDSENGTFTGRRWKLDWQNNVHLHPGHVLTAGIELERESGSSEYSSRSAWGSFQTPFPERSAGASSAYFQDRVSLSGVLFASAGLRLDRHSGSGTALTWRLAPALLIPPLSAKVRASVGTGFKAPSLYQLYAPGTLWGPVGNEGLKPERSLGWDLGLEESLFEGKLSASAEIYSQSFTDLIQFEYARGYSNIGRASSKGYEVQVRSGPLPWLSVEASYTRTRARDLDTGLDLLRRPVHKFSAGLRIQAGEHARLVLSASHLGIREDMDYSGWTARRVRLDPYWLLGASATLTLAKKVELLLRLDNILDQAYELVRGYGTAGFSVYAGLRVN